MTESFSYDFDTGRVLTSTGANGLTIHAYYDQPSLRLTRTEFPTGWYFEDSYDDSIMTATQTAYIHLNGAPTLETEVVTHFNGLELPQRTDRRLAHNVYSSTSRQYDALGRLWKISRPYQGTKPSLWNTSL